MPTGLGDEKLWLCPSLDDSSSDISGNGNHGTYQGNATTAADTSNGGVKAYYFATGGDCITHDQFGGPLSESQTVTWWSKHNSTSSRVHQISCTAHEPAGWVGGSNNRWTYEVFNNTTERFWPNGSGSNYNVTRSTANTWRHNCWVRDNGSGDSLFYVDGVLDTTVTPPSIYDTDTNISNLLVGLAGGNPTVDLYIDDVRTFGRPLGSSEITHLASARGVQGSPYTATGIGDEKLWLCPSLDDSPDDLSGNNHHGTYNGGMSTVSDPNNGGVKAYSFDGSNDYIDCGSASTIHSNSVFTYSIWIKGSSTDITGSTANGVFGAYDHTTGDRGALFAVGNAFGSKGAFYYQSVGGNFNSNQLLQSTANVLDGTWHHIVCAFDGLLGTAKFYIDATLLGSTSSNVPSAVNQSTDFLVGRGAALNFNGFVDDARIFDRALSDTEISHLATSRGIQGNPYQFNGLGDEKLWLCPTLNDSADDLSGNGNHGAYNGGVGTVALSGLGGSKAYDFDGSNDYISLSQLIDSSYSAIAFSAWVYVDLWGHNDVWIQQGSNPRAIRISTRGEGVISDGFTAQMFGAGPNDIYSGATSVGSTGSWHHWLFQSASGGSGSLYVDGVLQSGNWTSGTSNINGTTYIGASASGEYSDVKMDDIRVFDRLLTTSEITALASKRGYRNLTGPHPHPLTVAIEHPLG